MHEVIQNNKTKLKIVSLVFILFLTITIYNICKIPIDAKAEIVRNNTTSFSINDETYLNVALSSDAVTLNLQPSATGQFGRASMTIDVATNNTTGYNLTMTADTTSLSRSAAVNGVEYSIPTLESSITCTNETATICDNFPVGYWGYKLGTDNSTYLPMPTNTTSLSFTKNYSGSTYTATLTFGTKLSNSIPTGIYQGVNLIFVATTNYAPAITYMQEMDQTIANSMEEGFTYTLKDNRDGNNYNIIKASDGTIWMAQNLRITNSTGKSRGIISASGSNFAGEDFVITEASEFNVVAPLFYDSGVEDYGVYYNFCAAMAHSSGACTRVEFAYSGDICPSKWEIPEHTIFNGIKDFSAFPNPLAGGIGSDGYHAGNTFLWSKSVHSWNYAYMAQYGDGWISVEDGNHAAKASVGYNIRCIFSGE